MSLRAHKVSACHYQPHCCRPYARSPGMWGGETSPLGERPGILPPSSGAGSREKQENHHRLLLSDALQFPAKGSTTGLGHEAPQDGQNMVLLPPAPEFIPTLTNTFPTVVFFFFFLSFLETKSTFLLDYYLFKISAPALETHNRSISIV